MVKRILFFPSYLGGGFGHIGRCLALAQALARRGGESVFAVDGPHLRTIEETGFRVCRLSIPVVGRGQKSGPAYVYVPDMSYQIVRDGFDDRWSVVYALEEATRIIEETKPDILVGDGYPLTLAAGRKSGIPVVQLVKSAVHPEGPPMIFWEGPPNGLVVPDIRPVFNPVLTKVGLPPVKKRAEELLNGDLLLIPSIPLLDPMDPLPSHTRYVGPIVRPRDNSRREPEWLTSLGTDKPVVYITVGGAAGHGGSSRFFDVVLEAFRETRYQVVISTGGKIDPDTYPHLPEHVRIESWVPGPEMISRSDCVVFHGGYTRMEILMNGLPSVIIPFHSEQEYYGRMMERAGLSLVVDFSNEPYHRFVARWKGGNRWIRSRRFTIHARPMMTLVPEALRASVDRCLNDPVMRCNLETVQRDISSCSGPDGAIDMIGKIIM